MPWGGGTAGQEGWRQSPRVCAAQRLGDEGILIPSRQVWGWTHADLGITWMPGETEIMKMANLVVPDPLILFAQVTGATKQRPGKAITPIPTVPEGSYTRRSPASQPESTGRTESIKGGRWAVT